MADLTEPEILALAKAAGITIPPHLLPEVGYSLNGWWKLWPRLIPQGGNRWNHCLL